MFRDLTDLPTNERYEKKVKDYNFGSLIRTDAKQEYGESNTIFGTNASLCFIIIPDGLTLFNL